MTVSKKITIAILAVSAISLAVFFCRDYLTDFYLRFFTSFPEIKEEIGSLVQKTEKQILAPAPLRIDDGAQKAVLTMEGVIERTNNERVKAGLPPLKENSSLDVSAAAKAADMFTNQYFAHVSPLGSGIRDLAESAGYDFIVIGENLALGNFENDEALVEAWMNSEGHRENILNESFQEIGVAVQKGTYEGHTTWMAVQHFGKAVSACPQPDAALKDQIEKNKEVLEQLKFQLEELEGELQALKMNKENYNAKAQEYNLVVSRYNDLVSETKLAAEEYNLQVRGFNECAGSK
jgi:uncharacterized protein YkwD